MSSREERVWWKEWTKWWWKESRAGNCASRVFRKKLHSDWLEHQLPRPEFRPPSTRNVQVSHTRDCWKSLEMLKSTHKAVTAETESPLLAGWTEHKAPSGHS